MRIQTKTFRKLTYLVFLCFALGNAQPPSSAPHFEDLSSIRLGGRIPLYKDYKIDQKFIALDFPLEIAEEDFYIGGSFSLLKLPQKQENDERKTVLFPEILLRKYLFDRGFCPYAQLNAFYLGTAFEIGIKPNFFFFDADISLRYTQPFLSDPIQKYPYIKQGFEVSLAVSFNISFWSNIF